MWIVTTDYHHAFETFMDDGNSCKVVNGVRFTTKALFILPHGIMAITSAFDVEDSCSIRDGGSVIDKRMASLPPCEGDI